MTLQEQRRTPPPFRGQKGRCSWCGTYDLPKGRRTWCSDRCVEEYQIRFRPDYIRKAVWKRDKGICSICGVDADAAYREWVHARNEIRRMAMWLSNPIRLVRWCCRSRRWVPDPDRGTSHCPKIRKERDQYEQDLLIRWGPQHAWTPSRKSGWDADHIIPVAEGGVALGLDNYRTLCHPCHKAETRKLRARLREQKP